MLIYVPKMCLAEMLNEFYFILHFVFAGITNYPDAWLVPVLPFTVSTS